jgi:hypothetical protein
VTTATFGLPSRTAFSNVRYMGVRASLEVAEFWEKLRREREK